MGDTTMIAVNDSLLIRLISGAQRRIVFVAPGVSESLAAALAEAWKRLSPVNVNIVLDPDPEVIRLGYGTIQGLEILKSAARFQKAVVLMRRGVRIGLLVSDDDCVVYSPAPLLIEAQPKTNEAENGFLFQKSSDSAPITTQLLDASAKPGDQTLTEELFNEVKTKVQKAPPVNFELARRVRVFTSHFQYVELEMVGCMLSRKKARIPPDLLVPGQSKEIEQRLSAQLRVLEDLPLEVTDQQNPNRKITERTIMDMRQKLERDFLINITGYGKVIYRARKEAFMKEFLELQRTVQQFSEGVVNIINENITKIKNSLMDVLLPFVLQNPPNRYLKIPFANSNRVEAIKKQLEQDVNAIVGTAEQHVRTMKVKVIFKDITYESLMDEEFLQQARRALPGVKFLHEEHEAFEIPARTANQ